VFGFGVARTLEKHTHSDADHLGYRRRAAACTSAAAAENR
jgi:hypothetical protein